MARLRVASGAEGQPEAGFADTARAAMEQALAEGAVVVVLLYETPRGYDSKAVPESAALVRGMVETVWEQLQPTPATATD